jgi:chromosome segregation ATPase
MIKGRLLLSLIAFIVSFSISLLASRDFGRAVLSGCVTLFSALVGSAVAEGQYRRGLIQRAAALRAHIRSLQRRRSETYESIMVMTGERDRVANSLNSLNTQLHNLQVQHATVWRRKEDPSWNLSATATATRSAPAETYTANARLESLERKEAELNRSMSATLSAKQRAELALKSNQAELNQLQAEIVEKTRLKEDIGKDLAGLALERQKLEAAIAVLQPKVRELENYRTELTQFINSTEPKRQQVETSSKSLQGAIVQLQSQIGALQNELGDLELQILERRQQKDMLDQELTDLRGGSRVQAEDMSDSSGIPEWQRFFGQLQEPELQALRAIAKQPNPSPALKLIAETNLTMPELLIDGINERAMDTIGDLVIDPSSSSPVVAPEYQEAVQQWIEELA